MNYKVAEKKNRLRDRLKAAWHALFGKVALCFWYDKKEKRLKGVCFTDKVVFMRDVGAYLTEVADKETERIKKEYGL